MGREMQMNCWEFWKCGREKGGSKAHVLGICSVYPDNGRHCAHTVGTFSRVGEEGVLSMKFPGCTQCSFYKSEHYDRSHTKVAV